MGLHVRTEMIPTQRNARHHITPPHHTRTHIRARANTTPQHIGPELLINPHLHEIAGRARSERTAARMGLRPAHAEQVSELVNKKGTHTQTCADRLCRVGETFAGSPCLRLGNAMTVAVTGFCPARKWCAGAMWRGCDVARDHAREES